MLESFPSTRSDRDKVSTESGLRAEAGGFAVGRFSSHGGTPFTGVVVDETVVPLVELLPGHDDLHQLFAKWTDVVAHLADRVVALRLEWPGTLERFALEELKVLAPVTPRQIFQSGANYRQHVIELMVAQREADDTDLDPTQVRAAAAQMMDARIASGEPYVFIGLASAICGPYDDVVLPATGLRHDWELELGVVIGTRADHVSRADALAYIAGYTIVNDLTTRDRVFRSDLPSIGSDWLASKNAPTFLPTGPWLVPSAFVGDPSKLRITLELNGQVMQDESTSDMIFDVGRLVEYVSSITPLLPGDLLLTGSPAGNGAHFNRYLVPGDVMKGTITGLGLQRNACVAGGRT